MQRAQDHLLCLPHCLSALPPYVETLLWETAVLSQNRGPAGALSSPRVLVCSAYSWTPFSVLTFSFNVREILESSFVGS